MPQYLAPQVSVEEISTGARPLEGVSTSTAAFVGETERGPIVPRFVGSFSEYQRAFGGFFGPTGYMPYSVRAFFDNGGRQCVIARVVPSDTPTAQGEIQGLTFRALGPGAWGGRIVVATYKPETLANGVSVRIHYWSQAIEREPIELASHEVLTDIPAPDWSEEFVDLSLDPRNSRYAEAVINGSSDLVAVDVTGDADGGLGLPAPDEKAAPNEATILGIAAVDADAVPSPADFAGDDPAQSTQPTALAALEQSPYDDVAIVYAPNVAGAAGDAGSIADLVIAHCNRKRYRFAILDAPAGKVRPTDVITAVNEMSEPSNRAAVYHPWLEIADPQTGRRIAVPPGGYVAGAYARTDNDRGVFKAPANVPLRGVIRPVVHVTTQQQELLNPRSINAIREFPGRGIRIWGARTRADDPDWRYVPVRRLFLFLEASIDRGTQWAVFEPNDERLWASVRQTISGFLRTQWRDGALMGATEDEAFFVRCDRSTMTQADIDNGRMICVIGVAPVKPAEFVIFRIMQKKQQGE